MGSRSYDAILGHFPDVKVLGFTATPFRDNKLITQMFDDVAYTISTQELIDYGSLVPPKLNMVPFNTIDEADMFSKIINIYQQKHIGQKAVVFLKTIDQCDLLRNTMIASGIKACSMTSKFTGLGREWALDDFRRGEGDDVLLTVDVLTAGFDSPNLLAIFMPYKINSVTTYLQRVGRGLRPCPTINKKWCDIYVGSDSPGIEPGYWENITKQVLNAGRKVEDYKTYSEILEYAKDIISRQEYHWTREVVRLAERARAKGMDSLSEMIITKQFPKDMLDAFVEIGLPTRNVKAQLTDKQYHYLKSHNIYAEGLSKAEATGIIEAHMASRGYKPSPLDIVQMGKFKGKRFSMVPYAYWGVIEKSGEVYQSYIEWKRRVDGN
jgi:hypothetical protein